MLAWAFELNPGPERRYRQEMSGHKKVRKAVLPVAGLGTRFLPATKAIPKEMITVVDKPLVQYAVEECAASGIEHVILVTGRNKSAIEDHFDLAPELESFLEQKGKKEQARLVREVSNGLRVKKLIEKPSAEKAPSDLAITGRYLLPPEAFDYLRTARPGAIGEIQLTDGLCRLAEKGKLLACIYDGKIYDAGDKLGFLEATVQLGLKDPKLGKSFREFLRGLKL